MSARTVPDDVMASARRGLSWRASATGVGVAGTVVATGAAARLLTRTDFAYLLLVASLLAFGPIVVRAGLGVLTVHRVGSARGSGHDPTIIGASAVRTTALLSAVLAPVVATTLLLGPARHDRVGLIALAALAVGFESVRLTMSDVLMGLERFRAAVVTSFQVRAAAVGFVFAGLLLAGVSGSIELLLLVIVAVGALGVLAGAMLLGDSLGPRRGPLAARAVLVGTLPFLVVEAATFVAARGDLWVAARLYDAHDVALYGAAATIAVQLALPINVVNVAMAPIVARLGGQDRWGDAERMLRLGAAFATLIVLAGLIVLAVAGRWVLDLLFGVGFRDAWAVMTLMAAGSVARVVTGSCGMALLMAGRARVVATVWSIAVPVGMAAGVIAGRVAGPVGLAAAFAVVSTGVNVALLLCARRLIGITTLPTWRLSPRDSTEQAEIAVPALAGALEDA